MTWNLDHAPAAQAEGWDIFQDDGDVLGELQVQALAEPELLGEQFTVRLERDGQPDDGAAWLIVREGTEAHHAAARALIEAESPAEWQRIVTYTKGHLAMKPSKSAAS